MRRPPTETRDAIRQAALSEFCMHGYHATTLQAIAGQVDLSRGAVLHHFSSKAALLNSVVEPLLSALQELVDSADIGDPPAASEQEVLLNRLAALGLKHRHAVELLMHDIASCDHLEPTQAWAAPLQRIAALLAGSGANEAERIRAIAAIGAILHPVATTRLELKSTGARGVLMNASLAAIGPAERSAAALTGGL